MDKEEKLNRQIVFKNLEQEIKNIKIIQSAENEDDEDYQKEDDGLYREPLSIDKTTTIKILLSWGGGEDGYKLTFSNDKELLRGVYYMADWGEYVEVELSEEELNLIYDFYLYGEFPED